MCQGGAGPAPHLHSKSLSDIINILAIVSQWNTVGDLSLQKIILSKCSKLSLELRPPDPSPPPNIVINNIGQLEISQTQHSVHLNITLNNVERVLLKSGPLLETEPGSPGAAMLYGAIITSCVFLVLLLALLWILLSRNEASLNCWRELPEESEARKVSRAESWRYQLPSKASHQPRLTAVRRESRVRHNTYHGEMDMGYRKPQDCIARPQVEEAQYTYQCKPV